VQKWIAEIEGIHVGGVVEIRSVLLRSLRWARIVHSVKVMFMLRLWYFECSVLACTPLTARAITVLLMLV
jgi:hypothetical protein